MMVGGKVGGYCVTGRTVWLSQVDHGVSVAVQVHPLDPDEISGRLPLAPPPLPGSAVERRQPVSKVTPRIRARLTLPLLVI